MINSLSKDSHMGPRFCPPNLYSGRGAYKPEGNIVTENKSTHSTSVTIRKPAEPNFCGFSSSRLAHKEPVFEELIKQTRIILGHKKPLDTKNIFQKINNFFVETKQHKELKDFINNLVLSHMNEDKTISKEAKELLGFDAKKVQEFLESHKDTVKRFLDSHNDTLKAVIKRTQEILTDEHKKEPIEAKDLPRKTRNAINTAVNAYPAVEKPNWIYNSEYLKRFFIMADNSHAVFSALIALAITGIFRPATIMALPAKENNKDDKKYAAAHSIASGLIGYGISIVISRPIALALEKLENNPDKFLTEDALQYLRKKGSINAAKKYVNFLHEAILAPPRAIITIALIPPILKHVFGWEKKKSIQNNTKIQKFTADKTGSYKVFKDFNGGSK